MAHVCLCTSACRSYDVEENKGIIPDEVDDVGASPQRFSVFSSTTIQRTPRARIDARPRRRTAFSDRLVASSPIFYGWVIAALVALVALLVSPAQVYCVGAVVDPMLLSLELTRLQLSGAYAVASLLSAPLITLHPLLLRRLSRRSLLALCGCGIVVGLLIVGGAAGVLTLLIGWCLLLAAGPGMLYPAAEAALLDWWSAKRVRVQTLVLAAAASLGLFLLPAIVSAAADDGAARTLARCPPRAGRALRGARRGARGALPRRRRRPRPPPDNDPHARRGPGLLQDGSGYDEDADESAAPPPAR